ncbi:hypothetical protein ACE6H2_015232 [Prunus campanulata]
MHWSCFISSLRSLSRKSKLHLCPQIGIWASHLCPRQDAKAIGEEIERQRCFKGKKGVSSED